MKQDSLHRVTKTQRARAAEIGQYAGVTAYSYYPLLASLLVGSDPAIQSLLDLRGLTPHSIPRFAVIRKDGSYHDVGLTHGLTQLGTEGNTISDFTDLWLRGAVTAVADLIQRHQMHLNNVPELELLYHLRNGLAHGNRFEIRKYPKDSKKYDELAGKYRCDVYPAHNKFASIRGDNKRDFIITPDLHGTPVLFDFMERGDILDLLISISQFMIYLGDNKDHMISSRYTDLG